MARYLPRGHNRLQVYGSGYPIMVQIRHTAALTRLSKEPPREGRLPESAIAKVKIRHECPSYEFPYPYSIKTSIIQFQRYHSFRWQSKMTEIKGDTSPLFHSLQRAHHIDVTLRDIIRLTDMDEGSCNAQDEYPIRPWPSY